VPEEDLKRIADVIVARLPEGAIAQSVVQSLHAPTPKVLSEAASGLLAAGHLDLAETLYRAMANRPGVGLWPMFGLAQVASKRGDAEEMVAAWSECLRQYPDRSAPYWFFELARAERERKNQPAALEYLRQGIARFPEFAPLQLAFAQTLSVLGRHGESIEVSRAALRKFPLEAKSSWLLSFASALRAEGCFDEEEKVIEDIASRFPEDPAGLVYRAQHASRKEDWARAYDLWMACLERNSGPVKPDWLNGRAKALFRLWRSEEALEVWSDLIRRFPDFVPAHVDLALANQELGRWESAYQIWSDLISAWPDDAVRRWYVQRATCLLNRPTADSIETAISELEARFPDSASGRCLAIDLSYKMSTGLAALSALIEDATARYPTDPQLLSQRIKHLLAAGRNSEAERGVELLESGGADDSALLCRWHLLMARNDEAQVRKSARDVVPIREWSLGTGVSICEFLRAVGSPWAIELAFSLSEDLERRFPRQIEALCARSRLLITLRRFDEALALIDTVPVIYQGEDMLELRAWAAMHRGDAESARKSWETIVDNFHVPALHASEPRLELVTPKREETRDGVVLFAPAYNELTNLPHFLQHYRRIGVHRFVIVDNFSSDGTGEYLRDQPDVILYRTQDNFAASCSGMRWINLLMDRHGGEWCLYADADEELIYPGYESTPLDRLIEYLDGQGAEAMAGFMLDVYPERLFDSTGRPAGHADCLYYDSDYRWTGYWRCPYVKPEGGVRARLFGTKEYLHKVPLIKRRAGKYIMSHETTPLKMADVSGVFLHYKTTDLLNKVAGPNWTEGTKLTATDRKPAVMRRYEQYASQFKSIMNVDLRAPSVTQRLGDSFDLVDRGLMRASPEFRSWLAEQRRSVGLREGD
jgi:tetratricopeptide (TPR) repeat protein